MEELIAKAIYEVLAAYSRSSLKVLVLVDNIEQPVQLVDQILKEITSNYPNTSIVFDQELSKKNLSNSHFLQTEKNLPDDSDFILETKLSDVIIYPVLDIRTMSKLSNGITDTLTTKIGFEAFLQGKPIMAVNDYYMPQKSTINENYYAMLQQKYDTLQSFGVRFISKINLLAEIFSIEKNTLSIEKNIIEASPTATEYSKQLIGKKTITLEDVQNGLTQIPANSIITPLAQEAISKMNLE